MRSGDKEFKIATINVLEQEVDRMEEERQFLNCLL
jgi:hypothetical protein